MPTPTIPRAWRRHRSVMAAGTAVCATLGCAASPTDPSLAPAEVAGTYALVSASGGPLPLLELQTGSQSSVILADTLALAGDGTLAYRTTRARHFFRPGLPESRSTDVSAGTGTWRVRGRALALVYPYAGTAYADTFPAAPLPDASLRVLRAFQYPAGDTLRYVRVP